VHLFQRRTFVHRDVLGLVALDFILWIIRARVMRVSLVIGILGMNPDDLAADMTRLRVPGHVIANFEFSSHDGVSSIVIASTTRYIAQFGHPVVARLEAQVCTHPENARY